MKNYEETIDSVLGRVHAYEAEQKRKRREWKRVGVVFGCFCLVALVGLGAWKVAAPSVEEGREFPQLTSEGTIVDSTTDPSIYFCKEWNGKRIGYNLNKAIEQSEEDERFFISASLGWNGEFVYQGKMLSDYEIEKAAEERQLEELAQLLKMVEEVQNMKDIYQISTPEELATVLYGMDFYAKNLLGDYVVDGAFRQEKAEADYAACSQGKAREAFEAARKAYVDQRFEEVKKQLNAQNIRHIYRIEYGNGGYFVLDLSVKEFASFTLDSPSDWNFDLYGDLTTLS